MSNTCWYLALKCKNLMQFLVIHESKTSNLKTLLIYIKYYEWLACLPLPKFPPYPVVCRLVRLSAGLDKLKKNWMDFSQIWMKDGSWARINHTNFGAVHIIGVFCAEIEILFMTRDTKHKNKCCTIKYFISLKSLNIKEHVWGLQ